MKCALWANVGREWTGPGRREGELQRRPDNHRNSRAEMDHEHCCALVQVDRIYGPMVVSHGFGPPWKGMTLGWKFYAASKGPRAESQMSTTPAKARTTCLSLRGSTSVCTIQSYKVGDPEFLLCSPPHALCQDKLLMSCWGYQHWWAQILARKTLYLLGGQKWMHLILLEGMLWLWLQKWLENMFPPLLPACPVCCTLQTVKTF